MKRIAGYMIMAFTMLVLCGSTPQKCRILIIGDSISISYNFDNVCYTKLYDLVVKKRERREDNHRQRHCYYQLK